MGSEGRGGLQLSPLHAQSPLKQGRWGASKQIEGGGGVGEPIACSRTWASAACAPLRAVYGDPPDPHLYRGRSGLARFNDRTVRAAITITLINEGRGVGGRKSLSVPHTAPSLPRSCTPSPPFLRLPPGSPSITQRLSVPIARILPPKPAISPGPSAPPPPGHPLPGNRALCSQPALRARCHGRGVGAMAAAAGGGAAGEGSLRALYRWVDAVPLSRPRRNIARDFSDGGVRGSGGGVGLWVRAGPRGESRPRGQN